MNTWKPLILVAVAVAIPLSTALAQDVTVQEDVVYRTVDGTDLAMDIARPTGVEGPLPAIVCIHGGAWQMGSKNDYAMHIRAIASAGYVAAAVDYRLAPLSKWPAQIDDVKCAVRYLRSHASELNVDPGRIAALGDSAGGHLALLLGLMDAAAHESGDGSSSPSSKVQAVVNFSGPTDLSTWRVAPEAETEFKSYHGRDSEGILEDLLGTADRTSPMMSQASPLSHVDGGDPPIQTFHGSADPIVAVEQAEQLHAALENAGVPQQLDVIDGAGHGLTPEQIMTATVKALEFLGRVLK